MKRNEEWTGYLRVAPILYTLALEDVGYKSAVFYEAGLPAPVHALTKEKNNQELRNDIRSNGSIAFAQSC
jgi:hypothetical protein